MTEKGGRIRTLDCEKDHFTDLAQRLYRCRDLWRQLFKTHFSKKTSQIFAKNIFFYFLKKYSFHSKKDGRWQKTFLFWKFAICCKSTTGSSPVLPFSDLKHSASMVFSHRKYSFSTVVVEPRVGLKWNFLLMFCRSITFVVTSFVEASPMSSDVLQHWSHWPLADSSPDESFSNHIFESF